MVQDPNSSIMALDVGERRIGVAMASTAARIAHPFTTLAAGEQVLAEIKKLTETENVTKLCVGLPRGLDGQETAQTKSIEAFTRELQQAVPIPVYLQDEAVTSRQAEAELQGRGKPYVKGDIDALAATYILEDFLRDNPEATNR